MMHNCLIQLGVDLADPGAVDKLLDKIVKATAKQEGVVFAYATKAPSLTRSAQRAKLAPEELFTK